MKILVDTNIVLDIFLNRQDFIEKSIDAIEKALDNGDILYFSSSSVTDVYYVVRKNTNNRELALKAILEMCDVFQFASVDEECIISAIDSDLSDFEDALVDSVAKKIEAHYILTRNTCDYVNSYIKAITPSEYINMK